MATGFNGEALAFYRQIYRHRKIYVQIA